MSQTISRLVRFFVSDIFTIVQIEGGLE